MTAPSNSEPPRGGSLRPIQMVKDLTERGLSATAAADAYGVTAPTARKWLSRYLA